MALALLHVYFQKPEPPRMRRASCPFLESNHRLASHKRMEISGLCCLCELLRMAEEYSYILLLLSGSHEMIHDLSESVNAACVSKLNQPEFSFVCLSFSFFCSLNPEPLLMWKRINNAQSSVKEIVWHFWKHSEFLSCWELNEKIHCTFISVCKKLSYSL